MSYIVIARKYRPKKFDDLIGQEPIGHTLKNAISMKKISHAYLFSGPRGVGKTSAARILSKAVNCEKGPLPVPCDQCKNCGEITDGISMDVMEIDGASNRGIDEIRDLKEKVNYTPMNSNYKIYIIDEVHMLTPEAFNALLKTLEEPPEHIIFIFATTEPHKIPLTVLSRCQRFDFRRITINQISEQLKKICSMEKVKTDTDSLFLIAKNSDGSMRDAQSALDQLIAYSEGEINTSKVRKMFGLATSDIYHSFIKSIHENNVVKGIEFISKIYNQGLDLKLFIINFIDFLRNLFLIKNKIEDESILEENKEEIELLKKWASVFEEEVIDEMIKYLVSVLENFRYSAQFKILLEVAFFNLIDISKKITLRFVYNYIKNFSEENKNPGETIPSPVNNEKTDLPLIKKKNREPNSSSAGKKTGALKKTESPPVFAVQEEDDKNNIEQPGEHKKDDSKLWDNIIKSLKQVKPRIATTLQKGELKGIKDNKLLVSLDNKFFFNDLNTHIDIIEKVIHEKISKDYHLKFELIDPEKSNNKKTENDDPIVDTAKKIFKGTIVKK